MNTEQIVTPNIHTAILEVYKKVGYVQKTGVMTQGAGYKYASEADLIEALRPAMIEAGIIVNPSSISELALTESLNDKKQTVYHFCATYKYSFIHAISGTFIESFARGEGIDRNGDKATYKAATGAYKYALRQTFLIETGDDPDKEEPPAAKPPKVDGPALDIDLLLLEIEQAVTSEALEVVYKKHLPSMKQARMSKAEVKELFEPKRLELEQKLNGAI